MVANFKWSDDGDRCCILQKTKNILFHKNVRIGSFFGNEFFVVIWPSLIFVDSFTLKKGDKMITSFNYCRQKILPPRQRRNHKTNPIRIEWKNNLMKSTSWFWLIWTRSIFGSFFLLKMAIFDQKRPMTSSIWIGSGRCGFEMAEIWLKMAENSRYLIFSMKI